MNWKQVGLHQLMLFEISSVQNVTRKGRIMMMEMTRKDMLKYRL